MYRVYASRQDQGWQLSLPGIGDIWVRRLTDAVNAATSFIAERKGISRDQVGTQLSVELSADLEPERRASTEAHLKAKRAQDEAALAYRKLAKRLQESGISGAEIALILGVSRQRVSQLLSSTQK